MMTAGDIVEALADGTPWLEGELLLASENQRSLMLAIDEGVPIPFALHPALGCQILILTLEGDGSYSELTCGRRWTIRETGKRADPSKAEAVKRHLSAFTSGDR